MNNPSILKLNKNYVEKHGWDQNISNKTTTSNPDKRENYLRLIIIAL